MTRPPPKLFANLGAEEGAAWRRAADEPAVRAQRRLWRRLFEPEAAYPWLRDGDAFAWMVTEEAVRELGLSGVRPDVVRAVHDKAFAAEVARAERLVPPALRDRIAVLEPEALRAPDAAEAVEAELAAWPAWARERFTLKPRLGTSGRGRIAGVGGRLDRERLGGGLARLAERGGAILEPWLERTADFSVQMFLGGDAGVTVLGSLGVAVSPAGVFLGHFGELDSRGRVFSGNPAEEVLREAAARVGVAARERGYAGPCGVDAFQFIDPEDDASEPILRPVVELNARFTAGTVTVGLVRQLLPRLKRELALAPGERMEFRFWLSLAGEERAEAEGRARGGEALLVDFDVVEPGPPPLLFRRPGSSRSHDTPRRNGA